MGGGNPLCNDNGDFANYYLIWDADAIPLRDMEFFNKKGQILIEKASEYHTPYFHTMESLGIDDRMHKVVDFSFISEHLMIERAKMVELINLIESKHKKPFWEAILEAINVSDLGGSGFSEYETYGTFLAINYPQTFIAITRKRDRFAKQLLGENPSDSILSWYGREYEVCGFESWDSANKIIAKLLKYRIFRLLPPKFYRIIYRIFNL